MTRQKTDRQGRPLMRAAASQNGFTLFVAVLVASLVLAIGFSISNIVLKQLAISGSGGGSLVAFYAADSAVECAVYWDRKDQNGDLWDDAGVFATSTPPGFIPGNMRCGSDGEVYAFKKTCDNSPTTCDSASVAATTTFAVGFNDPDDTRYLACAHVLVSRWNDVVTGEQRTSIVTRGYNTDLIPTGPDPKCNLDRHRVVERGLLQTY